MRGYGLPPWHSALVRMFVCPPLSPKSYVEILMCNTMVLGGEAFGRYLGHESRALMNGISALIKETPQSSLTLSAK